MPWIEPSPGWHEAASCKGKIAHNTQASAAGAIKRAVRRDRRVCEPGAKLTAYKCRYCRAWHVGNDWRQNPA